MNVDAVPAGKRKLKPTSERSSKKRAVGSSSALPAAESAPAHNIVPSLKFKNLVVGMSVLGAVKEVHDLEIVVSLPNNLTGSVAITEISRVITERVERVAGAAGETEDGDDSETDDDEKEVC